MNSPLTKMGVFSTEINESDLILTSTALFVFLTASTWAGIVRIYFDFFSLNRFLRTGTVILVCSGNFSYLFTLDLLLYMYMVQHTKSIFLNGCDHFVEHIKCTHFIFNNRISLCNTAYGGGRDNTENHLKAAVDHGFTAIAPVDIMDAEGETALPVKGGKHLEADYVGKNFLNYDFVMVLSHFKGHPMAGFGGR